jgi:6,7-dimethyl-8-ribityllumazine synthase
MNILIVEARYHPNVADTLVDSAAGALEKAGARFERISVPGVLEIPAAIAIAARSSRPFDGYVALGSVTGPAHLADMFYAETMRGLMSLGAGGIALGNGIVLAGDEGSAHVWPSPTMSAGMRRAPACPWSISASVWVWRNDLFGRRAP